MWQEKNILAPVIFSPCFRPCLFMSCPVYSPFIRNNNHEILKHPTTLVIILFGIRGLCIMNNSKFLAFSVQAQQSFYLQAVQLLKTNRLYRSPPLPLSLPPRNLPLLLHLRILRTILCLNSKPGPKNPRTATITLKCMKKTAMCTAWMMTPCCTDFYRLSPATQKACTAPAEPLFSFRQCMPYL